MKKRILATMLATVMCVSLMGGQVLAATDQDLTADSTTNDSTINGESGLTSPIYRIVVPTTLAFAVDPFVQGKTTQIHAADYPIINKSNVPVKVDVGLKVVANGDDAANVKIKATEAEVASAEGAAKAVYFAAAVPISSEVELETVADADKEDWFETIDTTDYAYCEVAVNIGGDEAEDTIYIVRVEKDMTGEEDTFNQEATETAAEDLVKNAKDTDGFGEVSTASTTVVATLMKEPVVALEDNNKVYADSTKYAKVALGAEATTLTFVLDTADYPKYYYEGAEGILEDVKFVDMATGNKGVAVYSFVGKVNDKAAWTEGDLKATATYSFIGLSDVNYTAAADTAANGVAVGAAFAHALVKGEPKVTDVTAYSGAGATGLYMALSAAGGMTNQALLTSVTATVNGGPVITISTATASAGWGNIPKAAFTTGWVKNNTIVVNFTYDAKEYTFTATVPQ